MGTPRTFNFKCLLFPFLSLSVLIKFKDKNPFKRVFNMCETHGTWPSTHQLWYLVQHLSLNFYLHTHESLSLLPTLITESL